MKDSAIIETVTDVSPPATKGPPRKRRRIVVSCTECHRRKQKCDRDLPCANCRARNKDSLCYYEKEPPPAGQRDLRRDVTTSPKSQVKCKSPSDVGDDSLSSRAFEWGYSSTGSSTLQFLRRIESSGVDGDDDLSDSPVREMPSGDQNMRDKYKSLIRQLPSRALLEKLTNTFMDHFNWQYYAIEPAIFRRQMDEWNNLPFQTLSKQGPMSLPAHLKTLPAVMFQMMAATLLSLPEEPNPNYDSLKYAGNMTFQDLAMDYSESGAAIVNLFGKKHLSLTTIQATFLRAAFLKFTANVTEGWHTVAVAIRDAQELGMHRDSLDPKPQDNSVEAVLENQWLIQRRRRMYHILHIWDVHMAMILGRPCVMDNRLGLPSRPIDTALPKDYSSTPVVARDNAKEPPTPLVKSIWVSQLTTSLRDIQELEAEGPYPKDFSKVDQVHRKIITMGEATPAILRMKNPDTRWDDHPDMGWLREVRCYLGHLQEFNLMALHRPYVIHRRESRTEALTASIRMLSCMKQTFEGLPPESWTNFTLFFGSFDAIVMMASIYILFPHEHPELRVSAMQQFEWTVERFAAIQERNALAKSAIGVLKAILSKFRKVIGGSSSKLSASTPSLTTNSFPNTPSSARGTLSDRDMSDSSSALASMEPSVYPDPSPASDWAIPSQYNMASLVPMFPISDILFNDLRATQDEGCMPMPAPMDSQTMGMADPNGMAWQFGGDFGQDTLWHFLNQYQTDPTQTG